jgi:uncharacterized protein
MSIPVPPSVLNPPSSTAPAPPGPSRRVAGLDVIRGVAIVGTLASNIWLFTAFDGERIVDMWWRDVLGWLPNGKFLGLLTIMFGIGLEIQRQAARRHGRRWPGTYPVRAGLLFLDGMLNYVLVVQFDVLRSYALVGFVVAFVLLLPERRQWWVIGAALATHLGLLVAGELAPEVLDRVPGFVLPGDLPMFEGRPTYWQTVYQNLYTVFSDLTLGSDAGTIVTLGLVVFTLGAMLYRHGLFDDRGARLRRWLVVVGLGVGLPLDVLTYVTHTDTGIGRYGTATMVAFGVLALMADFYTRHRVGFVGRRLTSIGRMALSCYVLQNVLGRALQSAIGSSPLSGAVDPVLGQLALFALITVLLVVFSDLWLRAFRRGPLESVWDLVFRLITRGGRRTV